LIRSRERCSSTPRLAVTRRRVRPVPLSSPSVVAGGANGPHREVERVEAGRSDLPGTARGDVGRWQLPSSRLLPAAARTGVNQGLRVNDLRHSAVSFAVPTEPTSTPCNGWSAIPSLPSLSTCTASFGTTRRGPCQPNWTQRSGRRWSPDLKRRAHDVRDPVELPAQLVALGANGLELCRECRVARHPGPLPVAPLRGGGDRGTNRPPSEPRLNQSTRETPTYIYVSCIRDPVSVRFTSGL
jgi:hypothetical protein